MKHLIKPFLLTSVLLVGAAAYAQSKATLPFVIYDEAGGKVPYIASGYMGNTGQISIADDSTEKPHSGKTCMKVQYKANDQWGGVVWQSPANDWGNAPGGYDLTGAKKLTFWARGEKGGEEVTFSFGLIGADKPYHDKAKGDTGKVKLTTDWKQYEIDLKDKDMSSVKTGFCWVVGGQGQPLNFYLDDIKFE